LYFTTGLIGPITVLPQLPKLSTDDDDARLGKLMQLIGMKFGLSI
jgi:hypothetical protein